MEVNLTINEKKYKKEISPNTLLLDFLRDLGYYSVKRGCDTTNCGLCTVLLDEKPVLSCSVLAVGCDGKQIKTLEGLEKEAKIFADFIAEEGADQCGFCSSGFIMNVLQLKKITENPKELTEEEINHFLSGNLCRCTGYMGQMRAIRKYFAV